MPSSNLKNNKGNSPIIFIVLVGLLVLIVVYFGFSYLSSMSENQKIINQINAYGEKREKVTKTLEEASKIAKETKFLNSSENVTAEDRKTLQDTINKMKEAKKIWEEAESSELPDFIKNELTDCHTFIKRDIDTIIELQELSLSAMQDGDINLTVTETKKYEELRNKISTQNSGEKCQEANTKIEKLLNERGIVAKEKQ